MTVVKCPTCGREVPFEGNEFRPFCSQRCQLLDFGAWADEKYAVPAENQAPTEEELAELENAVQDRKEK